MTSTEDGHILGLGLMLRAMTRGLPLLATLGLLSACGGAPRASFSDGPTPSSTASQTAGSGGTPGSQSDEVGGTGFGGEYGDPGGAPGGAASGTSATPGTGAATSIVLPSGGDAGTPSGAGVLAPAIPGKPPTPLPDIVFEMESTVDPGGEALMCIYAQMPTDRGVIAVPSAESVFTPGSHHMLAYRSDLTSIPSGQTGVWNCADGSWMVHQRGSYYEAQQPVSRRDLPPGVAHRFQPGEVVIMQTHYLNPGTDPLDAHAQLTLHTVDVSTVPNEAGSLIWSDINIYVPPGARSRSTMKCPLPTDIHPALLWSHMHKQGSNFVATTDDDAAADMLGTLYSENDWAEPQPRAYPYDPPATLHAGTHVTFSCDFANPNSYTLTFGQSAETNEMCILHGMYWPRMSSSAEQCLTGTTSISTPPD